MKGAPMAAWGRIMTPAISAPCRQDTLTRQEKPRLKRHYFSGNRSKMG